MTRPILTATKRKSVHGRTNEKLASVKTKATLSSAAMTVSDIIKALGGPAAVARRLGIRSQAISLWARKNYIPLARVPALEAMSRAANLNVRAEHMRPDVDWKVIRTGAPRGKSGRPKKPR